MRATNGTRGAIASDGRVRFRFDVFQSLRRRATRFDNIGLNHSARGKLMKHIRATGKQLAAAGIDLLALRELMGHASPETTSRYVHLSIEHLAAEYAAARASLETDR